MQEGVIFRWPLFINNEATTFAERKTRTWRGGAQVLWGTTPYRCNLSCLMLFWFVRDKATTPIKNRLFLASLEFIHRTGCVPQYFRYKRSHAPFPRKPQIVIIIFLAFVGYCSFRFSCWVEGFVMYRAPLEPVENWTIALPKRDCELVNDPL